MHDLLLPCHAFCVLQVLPDSLTDAILQASKSTCTAIEAGCDRIVVRTHRKQAVLTHDPPCMNCNNSRAPAAMLLADFSNGNEDLQCTLQYVPQQFSRTVRGPAMR